MSVLHAGIMHMYPESPYVRVDYNSDTRRAEALDLFIGRPWEPAYECYPTTNGNIRILYEAMLEDPNCVYGFVYTNVALVLLYGRGVVRVQPIDPRQAELNNSYECRIPTSIYIPGDDYEVQEVIETYAVVSRAPTKFGHKIYFPERKLYFLGDRYETEG